MDNPFGNRESITYDGEQDASAWIISESSKRVVIPFNIEDTDCPSFTINDISRMKGQLEKGSSDVEWEDYRDSGTYCYYKHLAGYYKQDIGSGDLYFCLPGIRSWILCDERWDDELEKIEIKDIPDKLKLTDWFLREE